MIKEIRMGLTFRKASYDDLDAIERIYERSHDAEAEGLTTTGWLRGIYPVRSVAVASLDRGDMYVAELDGEVAATGVINQIQVDVYADCDWIWKGPDDDVSVLHTLAVDPETRGQGIGPAFVRFWEELAAESGCSILRIDTNAINKRARRMYAKLGYTESGIVPTVFNGIPGVDLVLMEKFIGTEIQRYLREMQDVKYADFQAALTPGIERERFIGVRTPDMRQYARELVRGGAGSSTGRSKAGSADTGNKRLSSECEAFLGALPHKYFEENQLHAFIISEVRDFGSCMDLTERFLPYINNWATCDQLSPKVFAKHADELPEYIDRWLGSDGLYTVRFGIGMVMRYFLKDRFDGGDCRVTGREYMDRIADMRSDEYYLNMMIAWYFATALAKQYDAALAVLTERRLDAWVHNKTIQKAVESRRITDEQKKYLRGLRIRRARG